MSFVKNGPVGHIYYKSLLLAQFYLLLYIENMYFTPNVSRETLVSFCLTYAKKIDYFLKFLSKILANYYIICYYLFVQQIYCKLVRLGIKQPYQSMFVCTFFEVKNE